VRLEAWTKRPENFSPWVGEGLRKRVGLSGLEPLTSALSGRRLCGGAWFGTLVRSSAVHCCRPSLLVVVTQLVTRRSSAPDLADAIPRPQPCGALVVGPNERAESMTPNFATSLGGRGSSLCGGTRSSPVP
jgi:hypothetical protein